VIGKVPTLLLVAATLLLLWVPVDAVAGPALRLRLDGAAAAPPSHPPWRLLPQARLERHGPDDPFPDDGYELQGSLEKGGLILIGVALSVAGLVTLALGLAQNKRMEQAICHTQLTEIWTTQRALGISSLALFGGATACLTIQFAF
jgi:hypothetical protein